MKVSIILTSYNEPELIPKAISQIAKNKVENLQLLAVAPDEKTRDEGKKEILKHTDIKSFEVIKDAGIGKPNAINEAIPFANGEIIIFTDGDMYISDDAIPHLLKGFSDEKVAGVSGHPVSIDNRNTFWGFTSHLFCYGAHTIRARPSRAWPEVAPSPMSGYLYAIKMTNAIAKLFPLPAEIRAEDAYISKKIAEMGYKINYAPNALAYVKFPKNISDWIKQKKRSLGGNIQIKNQRSIFEDLQNALMPIKFASKPKEYLYLIGIYLLRLYLWILIYIQHSRKDYSSGRWEQIKSSKI